MTPRDSGGLASVLEGEHKGELKCRSRLKCLLAEEGCLWCCKCLGGLDRPMVQPCWVSAIWWSLVSKLPDLLLCILSEEWFTHVSAESDVVYNY